jgi:hypothetical protein
MNNSTRLTMAAIALLSGISVAAAAGNGMSKSPTGSTTGGTTSSTTNGSGSMSKSTSQSMAKDSLSLTSEQKQTAWRDISGMALKVKPPSGFTAKVGAAVPSQITTHPVPVSTVSKVPELKSYNYALLDNNKLLIINPGDKKIAQIITK